MSMFIQEKVLFTTELVEARTGVMHKIEISEGRAAFRDQYALERTIYRIELFKRTKEGNWELKITNVNEEMYVMLEYNRALVSIIR